MRIEQRKTKELGKKLDEWSESEESDGHRKYPGRDKMDGNCVDRSTC